MPTAAVPQLSFRSTQASNYDEVSMHQSLLFADSLKDLKNLRTQLYSAAKYFELSFTNGNQKHMVIETLKDYTIKALVNTVDHLGSVSYKVNDLLQQKIEEACIADLQVSCIEQRMRTCEIYMNHEGRAQQSSALSGHKYHKRYTLPVDETLSCGTLTTSTKYCESSKDDGDPRQLKLALGMSPGDTPTLTDIYRHQSLPSSINLTPQQRQGLFYKKHDQNVDINDKRTVSPHQLSLFRGSFGSRTPTQNLCRSIVPITTIDRRLSMSEPRKSVSMRFYGDENSVPKGSQIQQSKSKRLLKALLSRRKSRKDEMLYSFLDEY